MSQVAIEVLLRHPHGDLWLPLNEWIRVGPGSCSLLRPLAARLAGTGERQPLSAVPFRYRNSRVTRFFISIGLLKKPWTVYKP